MINPLDPGYYVSEELRGFGFKAVGENVRISRACNIVGPENIEIGSNVRIDAFTSIIAASGWVKLGDYIHIGTNCLLGARGGIELADFSGLSHGVKIFTASDDFTIKTVPDSALLDRAEAVHAAPIRLESYCTVGSNSTLLPGANLDTGAVLGCQSLASRRLAAWTIYLGVPAKRMWGRPPSAALILEATCAQRLAA